MTCELKYYQTLTEQVLLHIMPVVQLHSSGLFAMVQSCNERVERARAQQLHLKSISHN